MIVDGKAKFQSTSIVSTVDPDINSNNLKLFWVGKASTNNPRPVLVIFGCEAIVRKITKAATGSSSMGSEATSLEYLLVGTEQGKPHTSKVLNLS